MKTRKLLNIEFVEMTGGKVNADDVKRHWN